MIGPVDALLAIAADEVQLSGVLGGPGYLAARQRQRRALDPAPRLRRLGRRAVVDALLHRHIGQADTAWLAQALVGRVVLVPGLGGGARRHHREPTGDEEATMDHGETPFAPTIARPRRGWDHACVTAPAEPAAGPNAPGAFPARPLDGAPEPRQYTRP
jgi:hypothetical protein